MPKPIDTHYKRLNVYPADDDATIREAYKRLALRWHPDKSNGDTARFSAITEAYAVLKDPKRRREYDAKLRLEMAVCIQCDGMGCKIKPIGFTGKNSKHCCTECLGAGFFVKR